MFRFWSIYVDAIIPIFSSSNSLADSQKIQSFLIGQLRDLPWKVQEALGRGCGLWVRVSELVWFGLVCSFLLSFWFFLYFRFAICERCIVIPSQSQSQLDSISILASDLPLQRRQQPDTPLQPSHDVSGPHLDDIQSTGLA
jgi:hypothetical protein